MSMNYDSCGLDSRIGVYRPNRSAIFFLFTGFGTKVRNLQVLNVDVHPDYSCCPDRTHTGCFFLSCMVTQLLQLLG